MNFKKSVVVVSAFLVLTASVSPLCACGVTGLAATPSNSATFKAFTVVDVGVAVILEGTITELGIVLSNVIGFILSSLVSVAEVQAEDPSFLPNVKKGAEQIKARVALGDYSACGSCTMTSVDLQGDFLK